jgi:hypothetical protein
VHFFVLKLIIQKEIFFIWQASTVLGNPTQIEKIGETFIPYQVFKDYLRGLAESTFR